MARNQAAPQVNPAQLNMYARGAVLDYSVERVQQIFSQNINPAQQSVVNVAPTNAGLLRGFIVRVSGTLNNGGASTANRTEFGAFNVLNQVVFTDLQNQNRITAPGWYLAHLANAKQGYAYGGAYAPNLPNGMGNNWTVQSMPSTIAAGADAAVTSHFWVPVSYSAEDLRGAVYMGVTQATANLQLTLNTSPGFTTADAASVNALAGGSSTAVVWKSATTINVTVYQVYYDQLPVDPRTGAVILPLEDMANIYDIRTTTLTGLAAGQDYPVEYSNLRAFLSTTCVFNNGGTLNVGSDVNYFSIQTANLTQLIKYDPQIAALFARSEVMSDLPKGTYYFSHRRRPLETLQYGNQSFIINPSTVNSGAQLWIGYESFIRRNMITQAGSIPGGG